ncbi:hypothetical protein D3C87_324620 [compost metagenome]
MINELDDYILSEARTDWISDYIEGKPAEIELCAFVKRMVLDALMDSQLAHKYLKDFE